MIHVTCDLCGKDLQPGDNQHYVVKIEVYAAQDPCQLTEADLDDDHLQAISEILSEEETEVIDGEVDEPLRSHHRFDLCPACQKKFRKDPLNREANLHFDFSEN